MVWECFILLMVIQWFGVTVLVHTVNRCHHNHPNKHTYIHTYIHTQPLQRGQIFVNTTMKALLTVSPKATYLIFAQITGQYNSHTRGTLIHIFVIVFVCFCFCFFVLFCFLFVYLAFHVLLQYLKPGFLLRRDAVAECFLWPPKDVIRYEPSVVKGFTEQVFLYPVLGLSQVCGQGQIVRAELVVEEWHSHLQPASQNIAPYIPVQCIL